MSKLMPEPEPEMLDPYSGPPDDEDEVDLSRDLSSDPNFDFAAAGWRWDEVSQSVVPPDEPHPTV